MAKVKANCSCGAKFVLEGNPEFLTEQWGRWQVRHSGCQERAKIQFNPKEVINRHRDTVDQGKDVGQELVDQAVRVGRNFLKKVL